MRAHSALWLSLLSAGLALPAAASDRAPQPLPTARAIADLAGLAEMPLGGVTRVALPVIGGEEILELTRFSNLAPGARVVAVDEHGDEHPIDLSGVVLLKGSVEGDPDSLAFLSVTPDQVSGFVRADGRVRVISSGEAGVDHAIRSALTTDMNLGAGDTVCSTDPHHPMFYPRSKMPEQWPGDIGGVPLAPRGSAPCRVARIAVDTDYEFTADLFGGNTAMSAMYAQTLLAAVSTIYERDVNVTLLLPYIRVWASNADPYVSNDGTTGFLFEMRDHWNLAMRHVPRNAVHGLSGRGLGGGVAYLNALCNSEYGHGVSANINGFFPMPVQDNSHDNWDLMVVAHELGHNFGSGHTHDGYTPPIDGCGDGDCTLALDSTIMSYCHLCPGGLSNVDMRFGTRVEDRILDFLAGAACDLTTTDVAFARDDQFQIAEGMTVELDVLSNDAATTCQPTPLTITAFPPTTAAGGTLELVVNGAPQFAHLRYTAPAGYSGPDSFTYSAGAAGSATASLDVTALRRAVPAGIATDPGVEVDYFALNNPQSMPDFDALTPYLSAVVPSINFPTTNGNFAGSGRSDQVGAVFSGLLEIPETGWYQLAIESDDGSLLFLGDELIVDNDGLHGMQDYWTVLPLEQGKHHLRAEFFENGGGAGLIVRYQGANITRTPVPASAWSRATGSDCPADFAEPYGTLNFFDMAAFIAAFNAQDPAADLAAPFGEFNFFDIGRYINLFNAGCP
jgi:hypothetical protein